MLTQLFAYVKYWTARMARKVPDSGVPFKQWPNDAQIDTPSSGGYNSAA
jgi:hypothetical protein